MIFNAHITAARNRREARQRLDSVNADPEGVEIMEPGMRHYPVKLERVPAAAARIIKQHLLAGGGDAALSAGVYAGKSESTDMIMTGTVRQYRTLSKKLSGQPLGLTQLAADLTALLDAVLRTAFEVPTPRGTLVLGKGPVLMGILNCTPDSFYDGGRHFDRQAAIARGRELISRGAAIIDVGGESTRPGADPVSESEELKRVMPVIEDLAGEAKAMVSIDTGKAGVARKAIEAGAAIINDVTALADPEMAGVCAKSGAALVLMHMRGSPRTMQKDPTYQDLFGEIIAFLRERMEKAVAAGVSGESIIVDPGIGFGKTVAHNLEIIRDLWRLKSLGRPILLGHSNKSYIGKVLGADKDNRFEGTAAGVVAGVMAGAHLLRVHDVAGMKRFADMAFAIMQGESWSGD